ncbi:MAG TPA: PLP-dependent aminotransferase family protein [Burkholderiaceae bacterium]|nr:PLP-dependent aminotransferase family protein [Burkholderiaceae bacterium]
MSLTKNSAMTLAEQLCERFAQRIKSRLLSSGARLPSVRQCAQQQGVSPSTVVAAYDQLLAQGLVEARKNRGFYVRELTHFSASKMPVASDFIAYKATNNIVNNGLIASKIPAENSTPLPHPVNAAMLIRGMFRQAGPKPQPGMGVFPSEWLDTPFLAAAVRKVTAPAALKQFSLEYGDPMGDANLRQSLSNKLAQMNINATPSQIISTVGATHGLDVVSRTLLTAGDYVMVEEPGWAVEFARLQALGMRILPVPRREDGPDLDTMKRYCEVYQPKLMVSVSVLHNPTGFMLSPHSAHRMLQLANEHHFYIMEDDSYSHIAPEHATRLCALDGLQRTIYVSGFAKILAPNWRVGYIAAPEHLIEQLLDTKLLATLTTPALLEKAISHCIDQGQLRRHATSIRSQLAAARGRAIKLALAHGCTFASEPAGLFGWVDTGVDTDQLAQRMLDHGYLLAPGALFHASRQPSTLMRINFATTQNAEFWKVFKKEVDSVG